MTSYEIAHLREQGNDMILIPLEDRFGHLSTDEQQAQISRLQACAVSAGLRGAVAVFWKQGGQWRFMGPQQWQGFLRSVTPQMLRANLNKKLTCG